MRTPLLFLLVLGTLTLRAQQFNLSYHEGKENAFGAVTIGSALYYLEQSQKLGTCCTKQLNLVKVRDSGQIFFRTTLGHWSYPNPPLISVSADNHLVIVEGTNLKNCDSGPVDYSVFKVDTAGNVLWEKKLAHGVSHMLTLGDSSIFLAYNNAMNRWDPQGNLTSSVSTSFGSIWTICSYTKDSFLLNYSNGGQSYLRKFSNSLQASAAVPVASTLEKMAFFKDGSLLGMSSGVLRRYDQSFTWLGTSASQIPLHYSFHDFCIVNDSVYCTGRSNWMAFYMIVSKGLSPLHQSVSNLSNTDTRAIALVNNRVNILGTGRSYMPNVVGTNPYIDLFQIPKSGSLIAIYDVGVTSFTVNRSEVTGNLVLFEADVTVKNFGTHTVHSFHLNNSIPSGMHDCVAGLNRIYFYTIHPGASLTVSTQTFVQYLHGVQSPPNFLMDLCLYTSVPEQQSDANIVNDETCHATLVSGLRENHENPLFSIFPNPGRERFTIEGEVPISGVEIVDVTGRLLVKINNQEKNTCEIEHALPGGVYLLRVYSQGVVITRKIAVD